MGSVIKKFEFQETHSRQSHPWEKYMDGKIRRLTKGEDYQGDSTNFATLCRTKAKEAGGTAKTQVEYEGEGKKKEDVSVVVQFVDCTFEDIAKNRKKAAKAAKAKAAKAKAAKAKADDEVDDDTDDEEDDF